MTFEKLLEYSSSDKKAFRRCMRITHILLTRLKLKLLYLEFSPYENSTHFLISGLICVARSQKWVTIGISINNAQCT